MSTTLTQAQWTDTEIEISNRVLRHAYERETNTLITEVRRTIKDLKDVEELWQVHDLLSSKRYDLDGKYDTRESMLVFTFAQLVKEGWVNLDDLQGLDKAKLAKISSLSKM